MELERLVIKMENDQGYESDEARVSCHPGTDLSFMVKRKLLPCCIYQM